MSQALTRRETTPSFWFERGPLAALRQEMDELFGNFFGDGTALKTSDTITPSLDVSETDSAVEVRTDLPGIKPNEVDIEIRDNVLTIRGQHKEEKESKDEGRKFHRIERRSGSFSRSVWLPVAVLTEKVDAKLQDGVLTVTLPKSEEERPRKVKVKG